MKKTLFIVLFIFSASLLWGQNFPGGPLPQFSRVSVVGNIELTLVHSGECSFEGQVDNIAPNRMSWSLKKGHLEFRLNDSLFANTGNKPKAKVTLKYSDIEQIKGNNGAMIYSQEPFKSGRLSIDLGAESVVVLNLDVVDLKANISNSTVTLSGQSEFFELKASGGASVNCVNMTTFYSRVDSQTKSECLVNVTRKLDSEASSAGKVFYKGKPFIVNQSTSSFGKIEAL